jgi:hypothetical protein
MEATYDALGVVLSTVLLAGGVKSDDLVAENVLARSNALWDGYGPGVVVGNELVRSPLAVLETGSVNLEELKVGRLGGGGILNLGEVVDDGTDVGRGPGGPRDVELATSSDLRDLGTGGCVLVAGNLGGIVVHGGVDETVVKALGAGPLNDLGSRGLVLERRVVGSEVLAVNLDGRQVTVGADRGSKGAKDGSGLDLGNHVVGGLESLVFDEKVGVQKILRDRSTKIVKNVRRFKRLKKKECVVSECRLTE